MKFNDLDIFPKLRSDYSKRTSVSGVLTILSILIMVILFISHVYSYFSAPLSQILKIDESPPKTIDNGILDIDNLPMLKIYIDIELTNLPCPFVDFGIIDVYKEPHSEAFSKVKLTPIDPKTNQIIVRPQKPLVTMPECGSCYGAASGCCNTCKDVKRAFKKKGRVPPPLSTIEQCKSTIADFDLNEKCLLKGVVEAPPVSGIIFISPGNSYSTTERSQHIADYLSMNLTIDDFNMSHIIKHLSIEVDDKINESIQNIKQFDKSGFNAIIKKQNRKGRMKALYFITAVKESLSDGEEYKMTINHYERYREGSSNKFPGIFFYYDVSPIVVEYKRDVSFLHFLVNLMAILGGIYSLATLIDHVILKSCGKTSMQSI